MKTKNPGLTRRSQTCAVARRALRPSIKPHEASGVLGALYDLAYRRGFDAGGKLFGSDTRYLLTKVGSTK